MARRQIKREPIISSIGLDTPHAITVLRQDQPSVSEDTELDVDSAMTGVGQANQSPTKGKLYSTYRHHCSNLWQQILRLTRKVKAVALP